MAPSDQATTPTTTPWHPFGRRYRGSLGAVDAPGVDRLLEDEQLLDPVYERKANVIRGAAVVAACKPRRK